MKKFSKYETSKNAELLLASCQLKLGSFPFVPLTQLSGCILFAPCNWGSITYPVTGGTNGKDPKTF